MADPNQDMHLYSKKKDVEIFLTPKKELRVEVTHKDPRHNMKCVVWFSQPDLIIRDVQATMELFPHPECVRALESLRLMIGKRMKRGIMKDVYRAVKNRGCTHLINLFQEACYSVIQGQGLFRRGVLEALYPNLNSEQIAKIMLTLRPDLIDSCISFIPGSSLLRRLEDISYPLDEEGLKAFEAACRSES
jgi:hypothetical protein